MVSYLIIPIIIINDKLTFIFLLISFTNAFFLQFRNLCIDPFFQGQTSNEFEVFFDSKIPSLPLKTRKMHFLVLNKWQCRNILDDTFDNTYISIKYHSDYISTLIDRIE